MSKIKQIILTLSLSVITFFLIEAFGNNEYKYYDIRSSNYPEEITQDRYQALGKEVKKEKQFNYNALFFSITVAISFFTATYKKAKENE